MGKPGRYTQTRRLIMQGVMVLVLGASVGIAALVGHYRAADWRVELGEPITMGRLKLRLPAQWQDGVTLRRSPKGEVTGISVREITDPRTSRILGVNIVPLGSQSVEHFLITRGGAPRDMTRINFLGHPGRMVEVKEIVEIQNRQTGATSLQRRSSVRAMVKLRSGQGVLVQLSGPSAFGPSARELVSRVAQTMELSGGDETPLIEPESSPRPEIEDDAPTADEPTAVDDPDAGEGARL